MFVILDNTDWLAQVSNSMPREGARDVTYELSIKSTYAANDLYNKTFLFFMVVMGTLVAGIMLMACLYRSQKKSHAQVMETKRELKRITMNK